MMRSYKRLLAAVFTAGLLAALVPVAAGAQSGSSGPEGTYLVTVENLTSGQPFTPPVAATHRGGTSVFAVGASASPGIQGVAENGDVPGLVAELGADAKVGDIVVGDAAGPVLPGQAVSFAITSERGHRFVSLASMLICTNDGFTGVDRLRLPGAPGTSTVVEAGAYDAGTEVNTEDFDDLVPPCGPLTGVDSGGAGTGMSNPALAQGGVIAPHGGIAGVADLVPGVHDWADPVARITVTRIDGAAHYEVTVRNATTGQPFTPPVLVAHGGGFDLFEVGQPASSAVQGLAENGDVPEVAAAADGAPSVRAVVVGDAPVAAGAEATYDLLTHPGAQRLTVASMLICTNDGFTGLDGEALPRRVGESVTIALGAYDAGTEVNTEDFDDLVPPCGPLTGVDSGGAGTGMSNPALAQGGVIAPHGAIAGVADLQPSLHGWVGAVGEVVVTRVG